MLNLMVVGNGRLRGGGGGVPARNRSIPANHFSFSSRGVVDLSIISGADGKVDTAKALTFVALVWLAVGGGKKLPVVGKFL